MGPACLVWTLFCFASVSSLLSTTYFLHTNQANKTVLSTTVIWLLISPVLTFRKAPPTLSVPIKWPANNSFRLLPRVQYSARHGSFPTGTIVVWGTASSLVSWLLCVKFFSVVRCDRSLPVHSLGLAVESNHRTFLSCSEETASDYTWLSPSHKLAWAYHNRVTALQTKVKVGSWKSELLVNIWERRKLLSQQEACVHAYSCFSQRCLGHRLVTKASDFWLLTWVYAWGCPHFNNIYLQMSVDAVFFPSLFSSLLRCCEGCEVLYKGQDLVMVSYKYRAVVVEVRFWKEPWNTATTTSRERKNMLHGAELLEMSPSSRDYEPPVVDLSSCNTKDPLIE